MEKETSIIMSAVVAEGVNYLLGVENQEVVNPVITPRRRLLTPRLQT